MDNKVVLVTGATGQQGGAVATHLLKDGWDVRALVRDPDKEQAQALLSQGVQLVQGDLYDRASLDRAVDGIYGVFSVQNYWLPDVGYDGEIKQGKLLADAAKDADVEHFVYTSVGAAHRGMGQRHFESKWIIERYLEELDLPHTIAPRRLHEYPRMGTRRHLQRVVPELGNPRGQENAAHRGRRHRCNRCGRVLRSTQFSGQNS